MTESARGLRLGGLAFMGATVLWALLLPIAAFAASRPAEWTGTHLSAALPYAIGAVVCHQRPARSFALWSRQLPVCARCTGIYAGAALGVLMPVTFRRAKALRHTSTLTKAAQGFSPARLTLTNVAQGFSPARTIVVAALPTLATLLYEWSIAVVPSNAMRALAGVPLGAAVALVILAALDDQVN